MTKRAARDRARGPDVRTDKSRISRLGLALGAVLSSLILSAAPAAAQSSPPLLPGQQIWANGVSSYLFGSNDTEEWGKDNVETDPLGKVQPAMKNAHMQLERTFVFHYSISDGHRTSIGPDANARLNLDPNNPNTPHLFDQPVPPPNLNTPVGYEVENRIKTIENMGMQCLVVFGNIWSYTGSNDDPILMDQRIVDPATEQLETDLDFARKVVAYLGNRCNMYEIGNEPDLDVFTQTGQQVPHMHIQDYVARWTAFVRALRAINPNAKFIGPVTAGAPGNDCTYVAGTPFPSSQPGDCYLRNFMHAVKGTDVEPDAISFHLYNDFNCASGDTPDYPGTSGPGCLANSATVYQTEIAQVRQWIQSDLGHQLPLGITEWNANPAQPRYMVTDPQFAQNWTRSVMLAMISQQLDFATQFDTQSAGGYCWLDMFNTCVPAYDPVTGQVNPTHGNPSGMFLAMQALINDYIPGGTGTPPTLPPPVTAPPPTQSTPPAPNLTYIGGASAYGIFSGNGVTMTLPARITAGQLIIAAVGANGSPAGWSLPTGWTKGPSSPNQYAQTLVWWYKVADGTEGGSNMTITSSQYADGGAVLGVWQGQTTNPIAGASDMLVNAGAAGAGNVTSANVGSIAFGGTTATVPIIITSWQNGNSQIGLPAGFFFLSGASDGYSSVGLAMALNPQSAAALPQLQLQFSNPQAIVDTQQIAVGVN